jgi:hypothetical protein
LDCGDQNRIKDYDFRECLGVVGKRIAMAENEKNSTKKEASVANMYNRCQKIVVTP